MKNLRQNKAFRVLCWQVFNALVSYLLSSLSGLDGEMQVLVATLGIPVLNIVTKFINMNVFKDIGVLEEK